MIPLIINTTNTSIVFIIHDDTKNINLLNLENK